MFGESSTKPESPRRLRPSKLVEVTPEFPEKLPKKIQRIIERFEPFEDLALTCRPGTEDDIELTDLMEVAGALTPELVAEIESAGKALRNYVVENERTMLAPKERQMGQMIRIEVTDAMVQSFQRFIGRLDANTQRITDRLAGDRRPLANRFTFEIIQYSLLSALASQAQREGIDATIEANITRTGLPEEQQRLLDTVVVASKFEIHGGAPSYPVSHKDCFDLLRDGAYRPKNENGISIVIPGVRFQGMPVRGTLNTMNFQHGLYLGYFEIENPTVEKPMAAFLLSRITGELIPAGMNVVSAERTFEILGHKDAYVSMRDAAFYGFLHAIETGEIEEVPYFSLDQDEQRAATFRLPKNRIRSTSSEASLPFLASNEALPKSEPEAVAVADAVAEKTMPVAEDSSVRAPSIEEQIALMNRPAAREERERSIWLESRITWHRVMRAFERLGITIEVSGAHPKLRYGKETDRYLNSHDRDPQRNKQEVFRVLRKFGISRDQFFAKLY